MVFINTESSKMLSSLIRPGLMVVAFALGYMLPQLGGMSFLIRYLIIVMLYMVCLQLSISSLKVGKSHIALLVVNLLMGLVPWAFFRIAGQNDLALAAFFIGITPTATAAPVIMSFLRGHVGYVVTAFLLTNLTVAFVFPLLLPPLMGRFAPKAFADVFLGVLFIMGAPAAAATLTRLLVPSAVNWPKKLRNFSFILWVAALMIIAANASKFLREHNDISFMIIFKIAAVALIICILNFGIGYFIGGKERCREASQSLGQKNTTLTIYLAVAYANPLVALGPTFYVLWHNIWNAWQLWRCSHKPIDGGEG